MHNEIKQLIPFFWLQNSGKFIMADFLLCFASVSEDPLTLSITLSHLNLEWGDHGLDVIKNRRRIRRVCLYLFVFEWKILIKKWQSVPGLLPENPMGQSGFGRLQSTGSADAWTDDLIIHYRT